MTAPSSDRPDLRLPSDRDATGRSFGDAELAYLEQVIRSGRLTCTRGVQVEAFERGFAELHGAVGCVAASSGTAALHAALAAVELAPGDEVVTTPVTDMGAITPILYEGGVPVFADLDPRTLDVTPETVAARVGPRTRAIVATHLFGHPCDVAGLRALADERGLVLIEDCAQAFLATSGGRLVGTFGDLAFFSTQQGKHLSTGEGGLLVCADERWLAPLRRARLFVNKAWDVDEGFSEHRFLALNYRMTELQGAVGRAQLEKVRGVVDARRASAAALDAELQGLPGLEVFGPRAGDVSAYWRYALRVDPEVLGADADELGARLAARGLPCAPRYIRRLAFENGLFDGRGGVRRDPSDFPGAVDGLARVIVLPWNERYEPPHVRAIADAVRATWAEALA